MFILFSFFFFIVVIPIVLMVISYVLEVVAPSQMLIMASPFECGFSPISSARIPFSLRFFLLAVLFLIFDVELALLLPLIWLSSSLFLSYNITLFMFVLILFVGLSHEMNEGAVSWKEVLGYSV